MSRSTWHALALTLCLCLGLAAPAGAVSALFTVDRGAGFALDGAVEIDDDGTALTILNAAPLTGFGLTGLTDVAFDLFLTGDSLDALAPGAQLFIDGADGSVTGDLEDFAVSATMVELLFAVTQDDFARFGDRVLMTVTGDFSAGVSDFAASVAINPVTPIPLPASLPLLAAALLGVAALRRRRA